MNDGWFWGLGAMIGETMMKFSGTMRVSAIGIFLRNLPKRKYLERVGRITERGSMGIEIMGFVKQEEKTNQREKHEIHGE